MQCAKHMAVSISLYQYQSKLNLIHRVGALPLLQYNYNRGGARKKQTSAANPSFLGVTYACRMPLFSTVNTSLTSLACSPLSLPRYALLHSSPAHPLSSQLASPSLSLYPNAALTSRLVCSPGQPNAPPPNLISSPPCSRRQRMER